MTFLNNEGTYELEARTQANRPATCLSCNADFKQNAILGVYGLAFCESCIDANPRRMPSIHYPTNPTPESV